MMKKSILTRNLKSILGLLLICMTVFCTARVLLASGTGEYDVKAAFIYNLAKFVDWPSRAFSSDDSPIVIGILGEDPFGRKLDALVSDKNTNGRRLVVKRFRRLADLGDCHILFVSASEKRRVKEVLSKVEDKNILTVGETDRFAQSGGVVNLKLERQSVGIQLNIAAAKRAGLGISSKLLNVADIVKDN